MNKAKINDPELSEFSQKLIAGISKAVRKMAEAAAAKDDYLVVSDGKGHPRSVPAKDLLKELKK